MLSQVILLNGQLQLWWHDTPVHLRPESTVGDRKIFWHQRAVMLIRYIIYNSHAPGYTNLTLTNIESDIYRSTFFSSDHFSSCSASTILLMTFCALLSSLARTHASTPPVTCYSSSIVSISVAYSILYGTIFIVRFTILSSYPVSYRVVFSFRRFYLYGCFASPADIEYIQITVARE